MNIHKYTNNTDSQRISIRVIVIYIINMHHPLKTEVPNHMMILDPDKLFIAQNGLKPPLLDRRY